MLLRQLFSKPKLVFKEPQVMMQHASNSDASYIVSTWLMCDKTAQEQFHSHVEHIHIRCSIINDHILVISKPWGVNI